MCWVCSPLLDDKANRTAWRGCAYVGTSSFLSSTASMIPLRNALRSSPRLQSFRITRPLSRLPQLRPYHQHSPRPSIPARLLSRANRTMRSKGPVLAILLLSVLAYMNQDTSTTDTVDSDEYDSSCFDSYLDSDEAHLLLSISRDIQRVDRDYANVPFDSFRSSMDYFVQLLACMESFDPDYFSPGTSAEIFRPLMLRENDPKVREPIHATLRDVAEQVHGIIASRGRESGSEDPDEEVSRQIATLKIACNLLRALNKARLKVFYLMDEVERRYARENAGIAPEEVARRKTEKMS
ncbi:hypothetical protein DFH06DRAFT_729529 [Mycena polygramma]|nr:hypothetical protein DFH06DRAFT_729529 [Mycena polygramma]